VKMYEIKEKARKFGFQDVGYWAFQELNDESERLERWLERGNHGSMTYLQRNKAVARYPRRGYPWARGALVFAWRWDVLHAGANPLWAPWSAAYARGRDYHDLFRAKMAAFVSSIPGMRTLTVVDATALQERAIARRAGLGWIGKNRYLIHQEHGGNVGLGELLVDCDFETARGGALSGLCGDCRLCLEACPTGALTTEGVDARRCLSYCTGESRGSIPREMRDAMGTRILGCDACLAVCPHGKLPSPPRWSERNIAFLKNVLTIRSNREFARYFEGSGFVRLGRNATLRNVAVACGNLGRLDLIPFLEQALSDDPASLVREHAAWAIGRIGGQTARLVLERQRKHQDDSAVRQTIEIALAQ
jgi:epoxyqueuosine reductase